MTKSRVKEAGPGEKVVQIANSAEDQPGSLAEYLFLKNILTCDANVVWLIEGLIAANRIYLIYGPWKSGKSLAVLYFMLALSQGIEVSGRRTQKALVFWVAGEATADNVLRIRAHRKIHGLSDDAAFVMRTKPAYITDAEYILELRRHIEAIRCNYPGLPITVVFDTFATNFGPGRSESSDADMGSGLANVRDLQRDFDATIILIHHPGHANKDRGRGHSSLHGAIDGTLRVERKDGVVSLATAEMRNTPSDKSLITFEIESVDLDLRDNFGNEISAPVLIEIDSGGDGHQSTPRLGRNQSKALSLLQSLYDMHAENCTPHGGDPRVLWADWRDAMIDAGISRTKTYDVKRSLLDLRLITADELYVYLIDGGGS